MWCTQALCGCVRLCPAPQRPSYTCVQTTLCTHSLARTNKRGGCPVLPGCSGWARKLGAPAASSNKAPLFAACWSLNYAAAKSIWTCAHQVPNVRGSDFYIFFSLYHINHTLQHYPTVQTDCAHSRNRATGPVAATPRLTTARTLVVGT